MKCWGRVVAGLLLVMGWSWLTAWWAAVTFHGSWTGYAVALALSLPIAGGLGGLLPTGSARRAPGRWRLG